MDSQTPTNNLILGTAQLGLPYGIANTIGQPSQENANAIVAAALSGGIVTFDTAQAYGISESVLGQALKVCNSNNSSVITKLPPGMPETSIALHESLNASLKRLNIQHFHCVMLHREEQLALLDGYVGDMLVKFHQEGLLDNVGISVYTPENARKALEHPLISIVQLPTNLFDRRFETAGIFELAQKLGKEIHIRSVFLQGILVMPPEKLPSSLVGLVPYVQALQELAVDFGLQPACITLGWVLQRFNSAHILFGAEAEWQVNENIKYAQLSSKLPQELWARCDAIIPPQIPELLNPALWKR